MSKTVIEKFWLKKLETKKVKSFNQDLIKIAGSRVFNVGGCLASCLIYTLFNVRSLALWMLTKKREPNGTETLSEQLFVSR